MTLIGEHAAAAALAFTLALPLLIGAIELCALVAARWRKRRR